METHERTNHRTIKPIQFGSSFARMTESRNISIDELAHPTSETSLAILINENKRLDVENIELKSNALKYHDQEIENAVLKEKLLNALNNNIATKLFYSFGTLLIGLSPTISVMSGILGVLFIICGIFLDIKRN